MNTIERVIAADAGGLTSQPPGRTREDFHLHVKRRNRRIRARRLLRGAAGIAMILLAWQAASVVLDLELLLPPPLAVLRNVIATLTISDPHWLYGPNIYVHLWHSFLRAMAGFVSASVIAIPLGLVLGRITALREFMMPSIQGIYPIPGIAWIPLAILWFGLGDAAVVFVVFATTFFPLLFNAEAGARMISPAVLDAGRCFGARGLALFFRVVLPATVPFIITGLRISLGGAWRMIVAGEMLASQDGIGYVLMESRFQFRAVDLMTTMILVAVVGYATEKLIVGTIERRTIEKWEVQPS
jgi:ABC-type nitrate/sulfonate/bicarbonate transport system permease component